MLDVGTATVLTTTGTNLQYSQAINPDKHRQVATENPNQKSFIVVSLLNKITSNVFPYGTTYNHGRSVVGRIVNAL